MPTISTGSPSQPNSFLPRAFSFGKTRRAKVWLTMATCGELLAIVEIEVAARQDARLHGAEIFGIHHVVVGALPLRGFWLGPIEAANASGGLVERKRKRISETGGLNTGEGRDFFDHATLEFPAACVIVACQAKIEPNDSGISRIETDVDGERLLQAAQNQNRADQKNHRECNL